MGFVSIIASFVTLLGFVGIFVKLGREKGENSAHMMEMRRDIEGNRKNIDDLEDKVNKMEVKNAELISKLSSDLSWIKDTMIEIKNELLKKEK